MCQRCKSPRVASVSAKCSDMCTVRFPSTRVHEGEAPSDVGIGGGDYVEFEWCLECGQIQGTFPVHGDRRAS